MIRVTRDQIRAPQREADEGPHPSGFPADQDIGAPGRGDERPQKEKCGRDAVPSDGMRMKDLRPEPSGSKEEVQPPDHETQRREGSEAEVSRPKHRIVGLLRLADRMERVPRDVTALGAEELDPLERVNRVSRCNVEEAD